MLSDIMWKTQVALHGQGNNITLPGLLVGSASLMVVYKHFMGDHSDPIKHFLFLIVIQMLPLVFLQMKILSCPDPINMLSRFGTKVLIMHFCFLTLRVLAWPLLEVGLGFCNLIALVLCGVALHFGFQFNLASLAAQWDVACLLFTAVAGALVTELLDFKRKDPDFLECTIFTASSYIEILAFVPAVWLVHKSVKKSDDDRVEEISNSKTQAMFFFAFLVPFYVMEDVISALRVVSGEPLAALGHMVHFLVLLDFSCFLLSHIYNPDKVHGSFLGWLPISRQSEWV